MDRAVAATIIGQYRVTGLIGQGGMGAVYAAEHSLLGRPAAIKVLLPELSQKQEIVLRFFNEARAATAIRHPGIVEIYDFGWTPEGAAFIVMEHLEGETLGRRSSRARFRWQAALALVRQIAGALAAAHAKGIVHRDLKPDNVFLVPDPEVPGGERIKLLDFGIAKLAGDSSSTVNVTKTGAVMGTPTYMAPEQCRGVAVDHRADLYALGCILFELCSGRPPFVGEGTGDVLAAHIHVPVPSLASVGVEVPHAVEDLSRRLLAKSPSQRLPSAEALIQAIDGIATERSPSVIGSSSTMRPLTAPPAVTTLSGAATTSSQFSSVRAPYRRRWIMIAAASVVAFVGVVVAVVMWGHSAGVERVVPYASVAHPAGSSQQPAPAPAHEEPATPTPAPTHEGSAAAPPPHDEPAMAPAHGEPATPQPAREEPVPNPTQPAPHESPATPAATQAVQEEPARPTPPRDEPGTSRAPAAPATQPPRPRGESTTSHPAAASATVDVDVDSAPAGAQVLLAGTVLGKTPFHGTLPRRDGDVTLVIRLAGYADKTVLVHAGQPVNQHIKLVRPATTRPPKTNRDQSVNPFGD